MTEAAKAEPNDVDPAAAKQPAPADPVSQRKHVRIKVSKAARISSVNGAGAYNCLVLDESPGGVLVELGGFVELPDEVLIQYSNGTVYKALRRQTAGTKIGFQFID